MSAALEKKIEELLYENDCLKKGIAGLVKHSNDLIAANDDTISILFKHIDIIGDLTKQLKLVEEKKEVEAQEK